MPLANVTSRFGSSHEVSNTHWDEGLQSYRVTVDGVDYSSAYNASAESLREKTELWARRAAAFSAMAKAAESRENRLKTDEKTKLREDVMARAQITLTDYSLLTRSTQLLVDQAVDARMKLEKMR